MPIAQLAEADLFSAAEISAEVISYALGVLGLVLSGIAIALAVVHWRAISKVHATIERAEQQTAQNLDETRKVGDQTLQALNLHELLAADETLSNTANSLAEDYAQILRVDDVFLKERAAKDLNQTRTYMNMAAEGHLTIGPEALAADEEIPSALLNIAEPGECFWASSVVSPAFWARASAYLQLQKERKEQKITINRVFIFKDQKEFENEHAQEQLRLQAKKGINVHYVVEPEYTAQDLVAVARPNPESQSDPDLVRYAAEFAVTDGRVTGIQVWSAAAGHKDRVNRLWNILTRFYDDSEQYVLPESASP